MNKEMTDYSVNGFSRQLKSFRLYRGYKTQAVLCKMLGISRQVWSLWELNKRTPTIPQLLTVANCLKADLNFFFKPGAVPEEYDLTLLPEDREGDSVVYAPGDIRGLMPFVKTTPARQLFRLFEQCRGNTGVYTLTVFPDAGTSRIIGEYCRLHSPGVRGLNETVLEKKGGELPGDAELVIVDDADRLSPSVLGSCLKQHNTGSGGCLLLCGSRIRETFLKTGLSRRVHRHFCIDCITTADFNRVTRAALRDAGEELVNLIRLETGTSLRRLAEILRLVEQRMKEKREFKLTPGALMNLLNRV